MDFLLQCFLVVIFICYSIYGYFEVSHKLPGMNEYTDMLIQKIVFCLIRSCYFTLLVGIFFYITSIYDHAKAGTIHFGGRITSDQFLFLKATQLKVVLYMFFTCIFGFVTFSVLERCLYKLLFNFNHIEL